MNQIRLGLTREKHMDHMVKVTPFIVCGYFVQCYVLMNMNITGFASDTLVYLGLGLISLIAGFITYDMKHKVQLDDHQIIINWFGTKTIAYSAINEIEILGEENSFSTIVLKCEGNKKYSFYFVDDAEKIKSWIMERKQPRTYAEAA